MFIAGLIIINYFQTDLHVNYRYQLLSHLQMPINSGTFAKQKWHPEKLQAWLQVIKRT